MRYIEFFEKLSDWLYYKNYKTEKTDNGFHVYKNVPKECGGSFKNTSFKKQYVAHLYYFENELITHL